MMLNVFHPGLFFGELLLNLDMHILMVMSLNFQIFGIALGFNLLFEYDDLITGICFATIVPNLLPYAISHLVIYYFSKETC
jgi:ethylene-insensitive protein 2